MTTQNPNQPPHKVTLKEADELAQQIAGKDFPQPPLEISEEARRAAEAELKQGSMRGYYDHLEMGKHVQDLLNQSRAADSAEVEAVLNLIPNVIRVCEGGGPENIYASLAVSMANLRETIAEKDKRIQELQRDKEQAITEANRRDKKWQDGIDEICGFKVNYNGIYNHTDQTLEDYINELRSKITQLESQILGLREALEFYANKEAWRGEVIDIYSGEVSCFDYPGDIADEPWEIAFKALSSTPAPSGWVKREVLEKCIYAMKAGTNGPDLLMLWNQALTAAQRELDKTK